MRVCWNWQTGKLEVLVFYGAYGFKSHHSHQFSYGGLAQLGEHLICIQKVIGSNPIFSTIIFSLSSMVEHSAVNRRVVGSSPTGRAIWRIGQVVKTPPFHGGIMGSNPVCVTINTAP